VHHHHHHSGTGKTLTLSSVATLIFVAIEVVAGVKSGSLALISDAGHNFTDALSLILAAFAVYVQSKPADDQKTFGYHRAGVLAAFVNALTLVLISGFIFYEGFDRLRHPKPVEYGTMLIVAAAALVLNGVIMWRLNSDQKHDLNVRAAFVHMMGDALGALGIMAGAIVIRYTGWQQIDPALSIIIGALIVWTAWDIIKESLNVLLEGLPSGLALQSVTEEMRRVDGVIDVHDLHIWSLGSNAHALSCHVLIEDMPPSASDTILRRLNQVLSNFHIHHTTVQFEHNRCALSDSRCSMVIHHEH
jgi:cobalt-zinc-cadmium efflux system protein